MESLYLKSTKEKQQKAGSSTRRGILGVKLGDLEHSSKRTWKTARLNRI